MDPKDHMSATSATSTSRAYSQITFCSIIRLFQTFAQEVTWNRVSHRLHSLLRAMSTVKEICDGVPKLLLDSPISDIHICDIASHITDWQELAPYLDLSEVEEKDIADCYPNRPNLQRREALRKWKEINGIRASYRRLICVLCSQGRANTAQTLKELLTHNKDKGDCLLYTSPSPRDATLSRMPSSA